MNIDTDDTQGKLKKFIKVLVVGDVATGKTALIRQYVQGCFSEFYKSTIGVDFATKDIKYSDDLTISIQFWDIAGQEHNGNMTRVYYQEACSAFVVFDVLRPNTFDKVESWKKDIDSKVFTSENKPIPCVLLANKIDLCEDGKWYKTKEEMDKFVDENNFIGFFETSARNGTNLDNAANYLVKYVVENHIEPHYDNVQEPVPLDQNNKKSSCCH